MKQQLILLLLGEVSKTVRGQIFKPPAAKSGPHYFEASVPSQVLLGKETEKIAGREVVFELKGYPPDILLIETKLEIKDLFNNDVFELEDEIKERARAILKKRGGNEEFSENYSVFTVAGYEGNADQFLKYGERIAALLKSERIELDPKEIEYTIGNQIKYAKHDLTIIDWDGAFMFDPEGDFAATIELLALANLQLLKHRILDRKLDEHLQRMSDLVLKTQEKKVLKKSEIAEDLRKIIQRRTDSINQFQALERNIKLIGDWYSARLYDITAKKFKLTEWRNSIRDKLESLEDIFSIVAENFSISTQKRVEWIQIIAFFILQIGWFTLIILEFFYFTR